MAIARYLAREMNLAGSNNLEKVKVDLVLDLCKELMDKYAFDIIPELIFPTEDKEEIIEDFLDRIVPHYFKKMEKLIATMGQNGYVVGEKVKFLKGLLNINFISSLLLPICSFMIWYARYLDYQELLWISILVLKNMHLILKKIKI